jgi:hypothetical protein
MIELPAWQQVVASPKASCLQSSHCLGRGGRRMCLANIDVIHSMPGTVHRLCAWQVAATALIAT